ncbi:hypothetical protein DMJ13_18915 [halophilic archaeon]|nr:hypothetical protein DMJ13_18915 [halophilic archaeon]
MIGRDKTHEALDRDVTTFIRSTDDLAEIANRRPFDDADLNADGHTLYIAFLQAALLDQARVHVVGDISIDY